MSQQRDHNKIKSIKRGFGVIHTLVEIGPCSLSELANQLEMAESTTHRYLKTFEDLRYVSRQGDLYQIGLRFARLGVAAQTRDPRYRVIEPYVTDLAGKTEERSQFVVEDHGLGIYIYQEIGEHAVEVGVNIGRQIHLHCSSAGKAILAHYPRQRVDEIIDRWELPPHTENTITDRAELYNELDRVRERGYAFNREEHVEGVHAIAAPIRHNQETIGVISVSGPANRLQGKRLEEELPSLLLSTINEIELNIAYQRADHTGTHIVE